MDSLLSSVFGTRKDTQSDIQDVPKSASVEEVVDSHSADKTTPVLKEYTDINCSYCSNPIKSQLKKYCVKCISCDNDICGKCADSGISYCNIHKKHTPGLPPKQQIDKQTDFDCKKEGCMAFSLPGESFCKFHKSLSALPPAQPFQRSNTPNGSQRSGMSSDWLVGASDTSRWNVNRHIPGYDHTKRVGFRDDVDDFEHEFPQWKVYQSGRARTIDPYTGSWSQIPSYTPPKPTADELKERHGDYIFQLNTLKGNIPDAFKKRIDVEIKRVMESEYFISKMKQEEFMAGVQEAIFSSFTIEEEEAKQKAAQESIAAEQQSVSSEAEVAHTSSQDGSASANSSAVPAERMQSSPHDSAVPAERMQSSATQCMVDNIPPVQNDSSLERDADLLCFDLVVKEGLDKMQINITKYIDAKFKNMEQLISMNDRVSSKMGAGSISARDSNRTNDFLGNIMARLTVIERVLAIKNPVDYARFHNPADSTVLSMQDISHRLTTIESNISTSKVMLEKIIRECVDS